MAAFFVGNPLALRILMKAQPVGRWRVWSKLTVRAERADQVQVDAVRPVPPTEVFRVCLADGPAAVRALHQFLRSRHLVSLRLPRRLTASPSRG